MKSNRGSIAIFMLLIVPVMAIGVFLLYDYLNTYQVNNQVIKKTRNISEIQLSNNNSHLFENYGILAYLNQDLINNQIIALNDRVIVQDLDVQHYNLDIQSNFMEATKMASRNIIALEAVNQIQALISPMIGTEHSNEFVHQMRTFEKTVELFFDFHEEVNKIRKLVSSKDAESILRSIEENLEIKLNNLFESYQGLLECDIDFSSIQKNKYESLVDESAKKSAEWVERVTILMQLNKEILEVRQEVENLKADIDRTLNTIESITELNAERSILLEELSGLYIEKDESMQELFVLEKKWDQSIERIIAENDYSKPKLMDKIAQIAHRIDEMIFDLEPVENLYLPSDGFVVGERDAFDNLEQNRIYGLIYAEYWMGVLKSFDQGSVRNFDPLGQKAERDSVINGEVEFLIAGKLSDPQNIQIIKMKIFALRIVANMIHITSDATKTSQISRTTSALPSPWNMVAHGALVTLWSSAEGYLDTIALLKGEGHHPIKKEDEWQLSFDQLMGDTFSSESEYQSKKDNKSSTGKVFYQDYLRLLLYIQSADVTSNRAMFLLDANLGKVSNNRFNLGQFSIGHKILLSYRMNGLDESQSMLSIVNKY